jgi:hypothetical protein
VKYSKCPRKRCIRQSVLNAEKNVKFLLNPIRADLFIVESAGQRKEVQSKGSKSRLVSKLERFSAISIL